MYVKEYICIDTFGRYIIYIIRRYVEGVQYVCTHMYAVHSPEPISS